MNGAAYCNQQYNNKLKSTYMTYNNRLFVDTGSKAASQQSMRDYE